MSKKNQQTSKRVKEMQAAQRAKEQRRRNLIIGGLAIAVIVVVVGLGILFMSNRDDTGASSTAPAGLTEDNGVVRGDSDAPVQVVMYEDFQCPACKQMEDLIGDTLTQNVDSKSISVEYRPIAFLDSQSTTDYSTRALATAACTLDESGSDTFFALHDLLFANQPAEGGSGLTDAELASLAEQAGADKAAVEDCQSSGTFDSWTRAATDAWSKAGFTGTPTILVDGEKVEFTNDTAPTETLQNAIDQAGGS